MEQAAVPTDVVKMNSIDFREFLDSVFVVFDMFEIGDCEVLGIFGVVEIVEPVVSMNKIGLCGIFIHTGF